MKRPVGMNGVPMGRRGMSGLRVGQLAILMWAHARQVAARMPSLLSEAAHLRGGSVRAIHQFKERSALSIPPPISEFKTQFAELHHNHSDLQAKLLADIDPSRMKLLISVLSIGYEREFREVHRRTWMSLPGICAIGQDTMAPPKGCSVFRTFVLGSNDQAMSEARAANARTDDVIFVPGVRDPAFGESPDPEDPQVLAKKKVVAWFAYAAKYLTWATHVAKMDLDTFPLVGLIARGIADPMTHLSGFAGPPAGWSESNGGMYYGWECGGPRGMRQGQFYLLSGSLVQCIMQDPIVGNVTGPDSVGFEVIEDQTYYGEDGMIGLRVRNVSKFFGGHCADPWYVPVKPHPWVIVKRGTYGEGLVG